MSDGPSGIVQRALNSLGKGFDITSDFRLKFCKGKQRLVLINEDVKRDITIPGFGVFKDVSVDIKCDKGDRSRCQSDVLGFNQMSEYLNQKCSVSGKIPSGLFDAMFGYSGSSWAYDASVTKSLAIDGSYINLFNLHIDRYPLLLSDEVAKAIPCSWDPGALARFIENYGTHIIVGLEIGGLDVVLVRQDISSSLQPSELKKHLDDLGDQLFTGTCPLSFSSNLTKDSPRHNKIKAPEAFHVFNPQQPMNLDGFSSVTAKDGIMVICSKRGGDPTAHSHCEWLLTVPQRPEAINFKFIPICSLLKNVPGKGLLSHAINLYLRYKPPVADLQYLLDFQSYKSWAPSLNELALGPATNRGFSNPSLQLNIMGPKLYVNTDQVTVGMSPVTGMRLYLEGMKCNRLAIHLQHLTNTPIVLQNKLGEPFKWRSSDDIAEDDRFVEPIQWKKLSHICTAPVRYDPAWSTREDTVFIVTGAQLLVKQHESKDVLQLCLLFSAVSNAIVVRSIWQQGPSNYSQKSIFFSNVSTSFPGNNLEKQRDKPIVIDSGVFPMGPPVQSQKLTKFVNVAELCKGPQDCPGYWIVTGAKLDLEKGKICLHVKFSLLCFSQH
ncbi:MACPF domain-containing protein At1g14780 [Macadamia integrifolia]|uniref:MACPF domain-containing protein At1g14780 n=1 Tax=Macadamia integrifolia TaxID=60698 RepID=UPI001C52C204|nr:MACPF domain-containing protein At1g14780 [Macadamia integrifolia]